MEHQQYTCPMHPEVIKDAPGQCPKCGMTLVPVASAPDTEHHHEQSMPDHAAHSGHHDMVGHDHKASGGHAHHAGMIDDFKRRFYVVLALTIPIMALSPMIQHWLGIDWAFAGSGYILLGLSTIVFFYGGWPFLQGLITEIKSKALGMMTLVAVAITVAYVYSVAIVLGLEGMDFFWELATLILIMLLGHWIEMKSIMSASKELELLVQLMPSEAHLVHGDHIMDVKTDSLKAGDIILVKPGEKIAADGTITEGTSFLNESMLTGESRPAEKHTGDNVIAGSINGEGSLKIHSKIQQYLTAHKLSVDDVKKEYSEPVKS